MPHVLSEYAYIIPNYWQDYLEIGYCVFLLYLTGSVMYCCFSMIPKKRFCCLVVRNAVIGKQGKHVTISRFGDWITERGLEM